MDDLVGRNLGNYQILELLGRGGMATVYKGFQTSLDRYVAVKVLPEYFAHDVTFFERFQQEAKSVARLRHPHITQVYDFGREGDTVFLVMEYVEGGTLQDRLSKPLSPQETLRITRQVAEALGYAHGRGIIHRDIKPSNILLTPDGEAVLSDFGIAKIVERAVTLTKTGMGIGTPEYMAPEQAQGLHVDGRSDIYSLGIVAYQMATGRVPYESDTPLGIVLKHMSDPLPQPRKVNPDCPVPLETLILRCLAKKPEDRYQSAVELIEAIDSALGIGLVADDGRTQVNIAVPRPAAEPKQPQAAAPKAGKPEAPVPVPVRTPTPPPPVAPSAGPDAAPSPDLPLPVRARPSVLPGKSGAAVGGVALVLVLAVLAIGVLGVSALRGRSGSAAATATPAALVAATRPAVATAGASLAAASTSAATPTAARAAATPTAVAVAAPVAPPTSVPAAATAVPAALNEDGSAVPTGPLTFKGRIAFTDFVGPDRFGDFNVMLLDLPSGKPQVAAQLASDPVFSPDGSRILYYSWPDGGFFTAKPDGSDKVRITTSKTQGYPAWSPDGKLIAFEEPEEIWLINADGSGRKRLVQGGEQPAWSPDGKRLAYQGCLSGKCGLFLINAGGDNPTQLTNDSTDTAPEWSPDGKAILFTSNRAGNMDVWRVQADGGKLERLTSNVAQDGAAAWSRDGKEIFFRSNRAGSWAIYIMHQDGTEQRPIANANVSDQWWKERISVSP